MTAWHTRSRAVQQTLSDICDLCYTSLALLFHFDALLPLVPVIQNSDCFSPALWSGEQIQLSLCFYPLYSVISLNVSHWRLESGFSMSSQEHDPTWLKNVSLPEYIIREVHIMKLNSHPNNIWLWFKPFELQWQEDADLVIAFSFFCMKLVRDTGEGLPMKPFKQKKGWSISDGVSKAGSSSCQMRRSSITSAWSKIVSKEYNNFLLVAVQHCALCGCCLLSRNSMAAQNPLHQFQAQSFGRDPPCPYDSCTQGSGINIDQPSFCRSAHWVNDSHRGTDKTVEANRSNRSRQKLLCPRYAAHSAC